MGGILSRIRKIMAPVPRGTSSEIPIKAPLLSPPRRVFRIPFEIHGAPCEQSCVFCSRGNGLVPRAEKAFNREWELAGIHKRLPTCAQPGQCLYLTGNEPLNYPFLDEVIKEAKIRGFQDIGVATSGFSFFSREGAFDLRRRGVTFVDLPIYAPDAESHDAITRTPGSFRWMLDCAGWFREAGVEVVFHSVVVPENVAFLRDLPDFIQGFLGLPEESFLDRFFSVWYPHPVKDQQEVFRTHCARLSTIPENIWRFLNLRIPCLAHDGWLPPSGEMKNASQERKALDVSTADRAYAKVCSGCQARRSCSGVHPYYLAIHGEEEFHPLGVS